MKRPVMHLIEHTHWDREWYVPRATLAAALVDAIAGIIARRPPTPFLLDGQTVLIEDALAIRPDLTTAVERAVSRGDLQVGPWFVLPDLFIPSAEGLIRNLLRGTRAAHLLGSRLDVCYSPDAFGHPAWMPTLARGFGLRFGVVWRGVASNTDLVRWRAADGSTIICYNLPPEGYEGGADLLPGTPGLAARWAAIRAAAEARSSSPHTAVFLGADHHAPLPDPSALRRELARLSRESDVRLSRLDEFLKAASSAAAALPEISGEQRWSPTRTWSLQGVHATRLSAKRAGARAELFLERFAEPLAALAGDAACPGLGPLLDAAWKPLLENQFHDTAAGTVADEVAREQSGRTEQSRAITRTIVTRAIDALSDHNPASVIGSRSARSTLLVWNPVPRPRSGVVIATVDAFAQDVLVGPPGGRKRRAAPRLPRLVHADGSPVAMQVLAHRQVIDRRHAPRRYPDADVVDRWTVAFRQPELRGLELHSLVASPRAPVLASEEHTGMEGNTRHQTNAIVTATLHPAGGMRLRRGALQAAVIDRLQIQADRGDCYTPERGGRASRMRPSPWQERVVGPFLVSASQRWTGADAVVDVTTQLRFGERICRMRFDITNRGMDRQLVLRCRPGQRNAQILVGTGLTDEWRSHRAGRDGPRERAGEIAPAQRFLAAPMEGGGFLVLMAPGHFPYAWRADGTLLVPLLRSVGALSKHDLASRPGHASWPVDVPGAQEIGHHAVEMACALVTESELGSGALLHELWEEAFLPLAATFRRGATLRTQRRFIELEAEHLTMSAIKPSADGSAMVLRAINRSAESVAGAWVLSPPPQRAVRVGLDEVSPDGDAEVDGDRVQFEAGPFAVVTVRVEWSELRQASRGAT